MNNPVTKALYAASTPLELRAIWIAHVPLHWGKVAPNTRAQWQNATMQCAEYFVDTGGSPLWVYNTLFTFLRDEQRELLLTRASRRVKHAQRYAQINPERPVVEV